MEVSLCKIRNQNNCIVEKILDLDLTEIHSKHFDISMPQHIVEFTHDGYLVYKAIFVIGTRKQLQDIIEVSSMNISYLFQYIKEIMKASLKNSLDLGSNRFYES